MKTLSKLKISLIILASSCVLLILAFFYYKSESSRIIKEKHEFLEAVANIKLEQIVNWREERIGDAEFFSTIGKIIKSTVQLNANVNSKEPKNYFSSTLKQFKEKGYFENVFITDVTGKILFSLDSTYNSIDQLRIKELKFAFDNDSTFIGDFYLCNSHNTIHFKIVSIIKDNSGSPLGAYIQVVDPYKTLYPIIQNWPVSSNSAEVLLYKSEEDHIVYINELRHRKNSALKLKIHTSKSDIVAVKGLMGSRGIIEGKDYRGKDVLADVKTVPGTDWFMVSKVDKNEFYSDLFYRAGVISVITIITILLVSFVASYIYKFQQSNMFKKLFFKEKELAETQEEYRTALYSIGDAVITTDTQGKIKQMNSVAENLTGWKEFEVKGRDLKEIFKVINEETKTPLENPVARVLKDGIVVSLANHTLLISKKGSEIPIADSGSPIKNNKGEIIGVVLVFRDQTEERAKERSIIESQDKFIKIFNSSSESISLSEMQTGIMFEVNNGFEKMFGYKRDEVIGKSTFDLGLWVNPAEREKMIEEFQQNGSVKNFEATGRNKEGELLTALISGELVSIEGKNLILLTIRDITDRKRFLETLKASEEKYKMLLDFASDAFFQGDSQSNFITVNKKACELTGFTREELLSMKITDLFPPEVLMSAPLQYDKVHAGETVKTVRLLKRKDQKEIIVEMTSKQMPDSTYQSFMRDITDLKKSERELTASQERFKKAFTTSPDSININRLSDGVYVSVNTGFTKLTGFTEEEIIGRTSADIKIWADIEDRNRLVKELTEKGIVDNLEAKFRMKDGRVLDGLMSASAIELNGEPHIISITRDISEMKKTQEQVKISEGNLTALINNITGSIWSIDNNYKYVSFNKQFYNDYLRAYGIELVKGMDTLDSLSPELRAFWKPKYDSVFEGESVTFEFYENIEGERRYFEVFLNPIFVDKIITGVSALSVEISDRKNAEKLLLSKLELEEQISNIVRTAPGALYSFRMTPEGKLSMPYVSEKWCKIFDLKQEDVFEDASKSISKVYPDDLDHLQSSIKNSADTFTDWHAEFRIIDPVKGIKWVEGHSTPKRENNGSIIWHGFITDITEKKRSAEKLEQTKVQYQRMIENAPDGIVVITIDGKFKYVSPSAKKMFGYSLNEKVDATPDSLTHPDDLPLVVDVLNKIIKDPAYIPTIEYRFKHNDGSWLWIESTFTNLLSEPSLEAIVINFRNITERKSAEASLRILTNAIEQSPVIVVITDTVGNIEYANPRFTEITGFALNEVKGLNPSILKSDLQNPEVFHELWRTISNGSSWKGELYNKKKNGELFWEQVLISPVSDRNGKIINYVSVGEDVTDRKKLLAEIIGSEEKFRSIWENSVDAMRLVDSEGRILNVNNSYCSLFGVKKEDLIGNPFNVSYVITDTNKSLDAFREKFKNRTILNSFETEILKIDGNRIWIELRNSFIEFENNLSLLSIIRDITDRKNLITELTKAKDRAEEMNKLKSYFFANMSHELRTPFVGILGFAEILKDTLKVPEEKEYAEQILKSSKRLTETLNKILNISRIEFDKVEINYKNLDVCKLLKSIGLFYSNSAKLNNTIITTECTDGDLILLSDPKLIEDVLNNLVSNAVKFTRNGSIHISASKSFDDGDKYISIKIADTGIGIPKEKQSIIWQEFRQASEGINRSFEGTGLGLSITKKYVELLKGRITLESEEGKGTTFIIDLPSYQQINTSIPEEITITDKKKSTTTAIKTSKPRILYVEDDVVALQYIGIVLKSLYIVDTAYKAEAALELIGKNQYDILLLDINLGKGIDGVELMQKIRQHNNYKEVPIIAVTAYAAQSDKSEFLAKGFDYYISKPFTSADLKDLLSRVFG